MGTGTDRNDLSKVTPAAIQLPQDEIANSPTELLLFPEGHRFQGQMAMTFFTPSTNSRYSCPLSR